MSHNPKCDPFIGKTKPRRWKVTRGIFSLSVSVHSWMLNVHEYQITTLPPSSQPTCGRTAFLFSTKQMEEVLLPGCKKRNTYLLCILACFILCVCVSEQGLLLADSECLWNGEVLPDVCRGCCRPFESRVTALENEHPPPTAPTRLTSLCGAARPAGNVYSFNIWSKSRRPKERERKEGRKRRGERRMGWRREWGGGRISKKVNKWSNAAITYLCRLTWGPSTKSYLIFSFGSWSNAENKLCDKYNLKLRYKQTTSCLQGCVSPPLS